MATLSQIIKQDRHPVWLVDALILSAVVYSENPRQELETLKARFGLPETAIYQFLEEDKLRKEGFEIGRKQVLLVVRSLATGHMIIACRGTTGFLDALTDLNIMQRSLTLGVGAAHSGFLDRAKSIPLKYLRRQLIRGKQIVVTGHSLGGAVASLLTLRLLEFAPKFCHEQVQCYTFGCPLFADSKLAKHINWRYRRHFVHIVSKNDIVPRVMPLAHFLYTLWAGLEVGPLEDVFSITRLALLVWQVLPRIRKQRLGIATVATQAVSWLPGLVRGFVHRLLALALSYHSGSGYSFAGQMVLLDADRSFDEDIDDSSDVDKQLAFQFTQVVSMDGINGHSLLSYIENVFSVQTKEEKSDSAPEVHITTVSVSHADVRDRKSRSSYNRIRHTEIEPAEDPETSNSTEDPAEGPIMKNILNKRKNPKAFRSKVACLIFAKRMQESAPIIVRQKPKERRRWTAIAGKNLGRLGRFARRWNTLFVTSSIYFAVMQFRKFHSLK
jgi:hypothetical protein